MFHYVCEKKHLINELSLKDANRNSTGNLSLPCAAARATELQSTKLKRVASLLHLGQDNLQLLFSS